MCEKIFEKEMKVWRKLEQDKIKLSSYYNNFIVIII